MFLFVDGKRGRHLPNRWQKGIFDVLDAERRFVAHYRNYVKAYRQVYLEQAQVRIGGSDNPADFPVIYRSFGRSEVFVTPCLDLCHYQCVAVGRHNVQFLMAGTPVPVADGVALLLQEAHCCVFSFFS